MAHLWFVTIHTFNDGNGRIVKAITDLQLARSNSSNRRFYSMNAQTRKERSAYYEILEKKQKGSLNITDWLEWFLSCLDRALIDKTLSLVMKKSKVLGTTGFNITK